MHRRPRPLLAIASVALPGTIHSLFAIVSRTIVDLDETAAVLVPTCVCWLLLVPCGIAGGLLFSSRRSPAAVMAYSVTGLIGSVGLYFLAAAFWHGDLRL
jgi:hypothetical protein